MKSEATLIEKPMQTESLKGIASEESVTFESLGAPIHARFIHAKTDGKEPVLIVSHGAGESHENYMELATYLAKRGISSLLVDMHGHGESGGKAFHVDMREWVPDIVAALDFLESRKDVDANRIGAFGLSSGGTAIMEVAAFDSRLKALVGLDATVMNTVPFTVTLTMKALSAIGWVKRMLTGKDLRISIVSMLDEVALASDPEINVRLRQAPGKLAAFKAFPLPGAAQAFFVNTIKRVPKIKAATLVIWGEDDQLDPVTTAQALFKALTCVKGLEIVAGNGHVGHLDRNRERVFELTSQWLSKHLA